MATPTPSPPPASPSPPPQPTSDGLPIGVLIVMLCVTITCCELLSIFCACKTRRARSRQPTAHRAPSWEEHDVLPLPPDMRMKRSGLGAKLERFEYEGGDLACAVCLENCQSGERMCKLPCKHVFHDGCVRGWLSKSCLCPVCRVSVHKGEKDDDGGEASEAGQYAGVVERAPVSFAPLPNPLRLMRFDVENDRWVRLDE